MCSFAVEQEGEVSNQPQATYDWESERELQRVHSPRPDDSKGSDDSRSEYERDRDRLIHSVAFRRLQGKTQIFASHWADFGRTRLTHTLEVAQIGRSIAKRFGVPEALVEAACLAHDLGHPPFGHVGEKALANCMRRFGGFDANAQSLRIVTQLEAKNASYDGLDLTRGVLLSMVKYPYRRRPLDDDPPTRPPRDGAGNLVRPTAEGPFLYDDQIEFVKELLAGTNCTVIDSPARPVDPSNRSIARVSPPRTIACQIMDWADDIAYSIHDLEDGLASGYIDMDRVVEEETVFQTVYESVRHAPIRWPNGVPSDTVVFGGINEIRNIINNATGARRGETEEDARKRYRPAGALRQATRGLLDEFVLATQLQPPPPHVQSPFDFVLDPRETARLKVALLKAVTFEFVLKNERMTRYLHKGRFVLTRLFDVLMEDPVVIDDARHQLMDRERRRQLQRAGCEAERARLICDYLSGLTESQAIRLYSTLFESDGGSPLGL